MRGSARRAFSFVMGATLLGVACGSALADTAPQMGGVEAAVANLDRTLDHVTRDLEATDSEIERARGMAESLRKRMTARARAYFKMTHAGLLPMGTGFESLLAHSTRAERLRHAVERDTAMAQELEQRRRALLDRRQDLVARKVPLEVQQKAMAQARAVLMEADDRKRAFDRAFSSSTGASYTAIYGASSPPGPVGPDDGLSSQGHGFRAMKGKLPFPLAGRAEVRMVSRPGAGGPGVEMSSPPGTVVRGVFPGRVAFADEYSNYGRVVIIDHGDHFFTLSGNLGAIEVKVGDEVGAGNRIGTLAGAGAGSGMLYFEIRHTADTLDPAPWFGL